MIYDERALVDRLRDSRRVGRSVRLLAETTSTNDECHAAADDPENDGLVVIAERQTAGRGRTGGWSAPPGAGLLMSVLLRSQEPAEFLVAWSALAVAQTLEAYGIEGRIKWPNDVLVRGRKICGILVERRRATVVGMGVNLRQQEADFPPNLHRPATSLRIEGLEVEPSVFVGELLCQLDRTIEEDSTTLFDRWRKRLEPAIGSRVVVRTASTSYVGELEDLDPLEGARVRSSSRTTSLVPSAEIRRLEPE